MERVIDETGNMIPQLNIRGFLAVCVVEDGLDFRRRFEFLGGEGINGH